MLSFTNVFYLFTDKLSGLGAGRFSFALVFDRPFKCLFFRHNVSFRFVTASIMRSATRGSNSTRRMRYTPPTLDSSEMRDLANARLETDQQRRSQSSHARGRSRRS